MMSRECIVTFMGRLARWSKEYGFVTSINHATKFKSIKEAQGAIDQDLWMWWGRHRKQFEIVRLMEPPE
jgi:hypothetical protein